MGALGHCYNLEYVMLGCRLECNWTSDDIINKAYFMDFKLNLFQKELSTKLAMRFHFFLSSEKNI
jgi:hypothetical protein